MIFVRLSCSTREFNKASSPVVRAFTGPLVTLVFPKDNMLARPCDNNHAFTQAIDQGNLSLIEDFITKEGIDVNSRNARNLTPLMMAVHKKNYPLVKLLIHSGALLNEKDEFGKTALDLAKEKNFEPIKDILLIANAGCCPAVSLISDRKSIE